MILRGCLFYIPPLPRPGPGRPHLSKDAFINFSWKSITLMGGQSFGEHWNLAPF